MDINKNRNSKEKRNEFILLLYQLSCLHVPPNTSWVSLLLHLTININERKVFIVKQQQFVSLKLQVLSIPLEMVYPFFHIM